MIIFSNNEWIVLYIQCQKIVENDQSNFSQRKLTSSNISFCVSNSQKPKDIQFTIMYDKGKQNILTFFGIFAFQITYYLPLPCPSPPLQTHLRITKHTCIYCPNIKTYTSNYCHINLSVIVQTTTWWRTLSGSANTRMRGYSRTDVSAKQPQPHTHTHTHKQTLSPKPMTITHINTHTHTHTTSTHKRTDGGPG